ncbi:4Fe-4S dicluster domain-containing protein [Desulfosoma caldarium]|uniref:Carbon-monoxide dehydrogenase iron sulfur subunit n=1 Tax=Desulfosoma caldarium TaxID=610254 RepID=A0A3N1UPN7_9BACT|nr:4Fe-4S dicluster domain-containing protein [Desulfosoma caldarium]ROQ90710.1 carbon-monoxide dehydrogenase iron sulfur subunit [Desulfosoma caldarium]
MDESLRERVMVRLERCVGCRSCELACRVAHSQSGTLWGAVMEEPKPRRRIFVEQAAESPAPFLCRHCEDAPCVRCCPTGALRFDETSGLVAYAVDRCIGCHACVMACPFGVVQPGRGDLFVVKCDRCEGRDRPACVEACPTRALVLETAFLVDRRRRAVGRFVEAARLDISEADLMAAGSAQSP